MSHLDTFSRKGIRISIRSNGNLRFEPGWLVTDGMLDLARNHKNELMAEIRNCVSIAPDVDGEVAPDYHFLMVATSLDSWEADDPRFGHEVMLDVCYRQLDAAYYAWLRHRTENARNTHEAGALDDATFNTIRERFNAIHAWAVRHIGDEALRRAIRITNVKSYVSPSEQTFAAYRKTWDEAWDAYQQRQVLRSRLLAPSDQSTQLAHLLSIRGYAGIRSAIVGDIVLIVRDDTVAVPARYSGKVRFTLDELSLMIGSSPEAVKQAHNVKRVFGGEVVPTDESDSRLFPENVPVASDQQARQLALECAI